MNKKHVEQRPTHALFQIHLREPKEKIKSGTFKELTSYCARWTFKPDQSIYGGYYVDSKGNAYQIELNS